MIYLQDHDLIIIYSSFKNTYTHFLESNKNKIFYQIFRNVIFGIWIDSYNFSYEF